MGNVPWSVTIGVYPGKQILEMIGEKLRITTPEPPFPPP
jgi:hypothetical protein